VKKVYSICEYGTIRQRTGDETDTFKEIWLDEPTFESFLAFVLENQGQDTEGDKAFTVYAKNRRTIVKVKNYVGVIETKNGVSIEILPKVYNEETADTLNDTKRLFLRMLRTLKDTPFVSLSDAHLKTQTEFPILESFISSYIVAVEKLIQQGIKHDYKTDVDNLNFLKGKLQLPTHLRLNSARKHKFFAEYTDYSKDNPQNRIVKTTLQLLRGKTRSRRNLSEIVKLLTHFDDIETSRQIETDLTVARKNNRIFSHYDTVLGWSEVFLLKKSFTNFSGNAINTAVLFPMERVFESYIASLFKKYTEGYQIKTQDKSYFLVTKHILKTTNKEVKLFNIRPDLVLEKTETETFVIDTKWKVLDGTAIKGNYGIKESDMYQLYAYGRKYTLKGNDTSEGKTPPKLVLIYPKNSLFTEKLNPFIYEGELKLEVVSFDLLGDSERQVRGILGE
jgi:5-methylcytosine-specific restriction enzyme subunit McrC